VRVDFHINEPHKAPQFLRHAGPPMGLQKGPVIEHQPPILRSQGCVPVDTFGGQDEYPVGIRRVHSDRQDRDPRQAALTPRFTPIRRLPKARRLPTRKQPPAVGRVRLHHVCAPQARVRIQRFPIGPVIVRSIQPRTRGRHIQNPRMPRIHRDLLNISGCRRRDRFGKYRTRHNPQTGQDKEHSIHHPARP